MEYCQWIGLEDCLLLVWTTTEARELILSDYEHHLRAPELPDDQISSCHANPTEYDRKYGAQLLAQPQTFQPPEI